MDPRSLQALESFACGIHGVSNRAELLAAFEVNFEKAEPFSPASGSGLWKQGQVGGEPYLEFPGAAPV